MAAERACEHLDSIYCSLAPELVAVVREEHVERITRWMSGGFSHFLESREPNNILEMIGATDGLIYICKFAKDPQSIKGCPGRILKSIRELTTHF